MFFEIRKICFDKFENVVACIDLSFEHSLIRQTFYLTFFPGLEIKIKENLTKHSYSAIIYILFDR